MFPAGDLKREEGMKKVYKDTKTGFEWTRLGEWGRVQKVAKFVCRDNQLSALAGLGSSVIHVPKVSSACPHHSTAQTPPNKLSLFCSVP